MHTPSNADAVPSPDASPRLAARPTRSTPARSTTTISPGLTSRTYSAPTMSNAHVSDATTQACWSRPGAGASRPRASGRKPDGSRAAIRASSVRMASENAPSHWWSASTIRATGPSSGLWAARCRMSSVSDDDENSVPRSTSRSRIDRALDRLPLWAKARCPSRSCATNGWMLAGFVALPDVEYRVWPIAESPRSVVSNRSSSSNTSRTSPKSLWTGITRRPLASS